MSRHWDVYCADCDVGMGLRGNHEDEGALAIAKDAAALASVPHLYVDLYETYGFYNEGNNVKGVAWFAEHADHRLVARSEYGDVREVESG